MDPYGAAAGATSASRAAPPQPAEQPLAGPALGAVAPTVVLVAKAARAIVGTRLEDEALAKLTTACEAACSPIDDKRGTVEYRTEVAGVLARRAARIAYDRARGKR